jgi:ligand-binding sensor domain-containing protein
MGLISDRIIQLERDNRGLYALCERDSARGLCRLDTGRDHWQMLIGTARFPELTAASGRASVTSIREFGGRLWVATDRAGIGVYDPAVHDWVAFHRAGAGGLSDDRVRDLVVAPHGDVWVATDSGIDRYRGGRWQHFTPPVGKAVAQLHVQGDDLWYRTAGGGLGCFDGSNWRTVTSETRWGRRGDDDIAQVAHDASRNWLWFAAKNGSVGRYDRTTRVWDEFPAPSGAVISSTRAGAGPNQPHLWASTDAGLIGLDAVKRRWSAPVLPNLNVTAFDAGNGSVVAIGKPRAQPDSPPLLVAADRGPWRTLVGGGAARAGVDSPQSACYDPFAGLLYVGGKRGISIYDQTKRQWVADQTSERAKLPQGAVIDLQHDGRRVWVLTSDGTVTAWSPADRSWQPMLGGGRFPGTLADVTAVTRDGAGRLWIAARNNGVHVYEPARSHWEPVAGPEGVTHLAGSKDGAWMLASGRAYFAGGPGRVAAAGAELGGLVTLFAAPDTAGALVMDTDGQVIQLTDARTARLIVGAAAKHLDPRAVRAVGVLGDRLVVGGPTPYVYDPSARSWKSVPIGELDQIVGGPERLWLRLKDLSVFEWKLTDEEPRRTDLDSVVAMAGAGNAAVALRQDGGLSVFDSSTDHWREMLAPASGPGAEFLRGGNLAAAAEGDSLYLARAGAESVWHFSWSRQRWDKVVDAGGRNLSGITHLVPGCGRVFAFASETGTVHAIVAGTARAEVQAVPPARSIEGTDDSVALTDHRGGVAVFTREEPTWTATLAGGQGLAPGEEPRDAIGLPEGVVLAATNAAALLSSKNLSWKPIAGTVSIHKLLSSPLDSSLWAISADGKLFRCDRSGPNWSWGPVTFGGGSGPAASVTIGGARVGARNWVCLEDGSIQEISPDGKAATWRTPSRAPGQASEVVGVVSMGASDLVAFRNGVLAHYSVKDRTWSRENDPAVPGISQILGLANQGHVRSPWVLGTNGELHARLANDGPRWVCLAKDISQIVPSGSSILGLSRATGAVRRFEATGRVADVSPATQPPRAKIAPDSAGEIAAGQSILVLAGGGFLAAYDPKRRSWSTQASGVVRLHSIAGGLIGVTNDGSASLIEWTGADIRTSEFPTGGRVVQLATSGRDRKVLAQLDDGRIVFFDGAGESKTLLGKSLPASVQTSRILGLDAKDGTLFLTVEDRGLFAYSSSARGWERIDGAPKVGQRRISWQNGEYSVVLSPDGKTASLEPIDPAKGTKWALDLAALGFTSDRIDGLGLTTKWAYVATPGQIRRFSLDAGSPASPLTFGDARGPIAFRAGAHRLLARSGDGFFELPDEGEPRTIALDERGRASFQAMLDGQRWLVEVKDGAVRIAYRFDKGETRDLAFDSANGFGCDRPQQLAAVESALILATPAGTFMAIRPENGGSLGLDDLVPLAGIAGPVGEFWKSIDSTLWANSADGSEWSRLDIENRRWLPPGPIPDNITAQRAQLCREGPRQWRRSGTNLELVESTDGGAAISRLAADGRFDADHVRAVLETERGLWLATASGLRLVSHVDGSLLAALTAEPFRAARCQFRHQGKAWYLSAERQGTTSVFQLEGDTWRPVDKEHPFSQSTRLVDLERFRVDRRDGRLAFQILADPTGKRWLDITYRADRGRFDFQQIGAAVGKGSEVLTLTPAGLFVWSRRADEFVLSSVRRDVASLRVSRQDRQPIIEATGPSRLERYEGEGRWTEVRLSDDDRGTLARSSRWNVAATAEAVSIHVRLNEGWKSLPLDAAGDFRFRHVAKVAMPTPETIITASAEFIAEFPVRTTAPWTPEDIARVAELGPDSQANVDDLFSLNGTAFIQTGPTLLRRAGQHNWRPEADPGGTRRAQETLVDSGSWRWERARNGGVRIHRRLDGGRALEVSWLAGAGRFDLDAAVDAALWRDSIWLSTPLGLNRLSAADRRSTHVLASRGSPPPRFSFDRRKGRLLASDALGQPTTELRYDAPAEPRRGDPISTAEAAEIRTAALCDDTWQITLGPSPRLSWHGIASGLSEGHFVHDRFHEIAVDNGKLWISTPVAILHQSISPASLVLTEVVPRPPSQGDFGIASVDKGVLRCVNRQGNLVEWQGVAGWVRPAQSGIFDGRSLVETPFWRWSRKPNGSLDVVVLPADAGNLDPPVERSGRFAFDEAETLLVEGDAVWSAGPGAIVKQRSADGGIVRWFRLGNDGAQTTPLGRIVRLGRFSQRGDPVPSSSPPERLAGADLYALGADGRAWQFRQTGPGGWQLASANPWAAEGGRWLLRTDSVEAIATDRGGIRLHHRAEVNRPRHGPETMAPLLLGGRFQSDEVRSFALAGAVGYLATPAGLIELNAKSGEPERIWKQPAGSTTASLTACDQVVLEEGNGMPFASTTRDALFQFRSIDSQWHSVEPAGLSRAYELQVKNEFWEWRRWRGLVWATLHRAGPASRDWPLFVDGRFSFDIPRKFTTARGELWMATPGGIIRIRPDDMAILAIDRLGIDSVTGQPVDLTDAIGFERSDRLIAYGEQALYERKEERWLRLTGSRRPEKIAADVRSRGSWMVEPMSGDGFEVRRYDADDRLRSRRQILAGIPESRLRRVVAADGYLWICLDRGLYRISP